MPEINPIRPTTPEAIQLAQTMLRVSRYGALAVLDAKTGKPIATRVAVATDTDGTPIILVSGLAAHTPSLIAHPSCSLLLGEVGKGDPLAHARVTLHCEAEKVDRNSPEYPQIRRRYLNHNPKGKLYVDLGDFIFFRLNVETASLNGGFGRAFDLTHDDLISDQSASKAIASGEQQALEILNQQYAPAIKAYIAGIKDSLANWKITGLDPDGYNLANGDQIVREHFSSPCDSIEKCSNALAKRLKDCA